MGNKKILDVSKYNIVVDYNKAAKSIDGVIIRCGYRGLSNGKLTEDPLFGKHAKGFSDAGVKIGVYFFTTAINSSEAAEEAAFTYSLIKKYGLQIDFPVFIDSEMSNNTHTGRSDNLSKSIRTDCIVTFCEKIQALGYTAGIYASDSWFISYLNLSSITKYKLWVARYSTSAPKYVKEYVGWQYTSNGQIEGINGRVDLSNWYESISENNQIKPVINGNPYAEPNIVIKRGHKGEGVYWLQYELSKSGYTIDIDGEFGPKTEKILIEYQKSRGLEPDGKMGSITRLSFKNNKTPIADKIKLEAGAGPFKLNKINLFTNSKTNTAKKEVSGEYYIWNENIVNDKIRICKTKDGANKLYVNTIFSFNKGE